ncbi:MAG: hypothetical protein H0V21_02520 [Rubrobacter sp.]|nr:hypothetical protein [Rubrobacter sp.]
MTCRASPLFEAIPNFSEGRDGGKISRITDAVRAVSGVRILGLHSDPDHNRCVLTFAGEEDAVLSGAVVLARAGPRTRDVALLTARPSDCVAARAWSFASADLHRRTSLLRGGATLQPRTD